MMEDNVQEMPEEQKPWEDIDMAHRMERMRGVVKSLELRLRQLAERNHRLSSMLDSHKHCADGTAVVSCRLADSSGSLPGATCPGDSKPWF